jgi:hypothetical protein
MVDPPERKVIHSQNFGSLDRCRSCQFCQSQERVTADGHPDLLEQTRTSPPTQDHRKQAQSGSQSGSPPWVAGNHLWQVLDEGLLRTLSILTAKATHMQFQLHGLTTHRQIVQRACIITMNTVRDLPTSRTHRCWVGCTSGNLQRGLITGTCSISNPGNEMGIVTKKKSLQNDIALLRIFLFFFIYEPRLQNQHEMCG